MRVTKAVPFFFLFVAGSLVASATSLVSVSAGSGINSCSKSDPTFASCVVQASNGDPLAEADGTATWALNGSGRLETIANGFRSVANSSVSFSNALVVTGGSGSGFLQITLLGFQSNVIFPSATAVVSPVSVGVGSSSGTAVLGSNSYQPIVFNDPITFSSLTPFSVSFNAMATGATVRPNEPPAPGFADGVLLFPTFQVFDASGRALPNAVVSFAPEPSTWGLFTLGVVPMSALSWRRRRTTSKSV